MDGTSWFVVIVAAIVVIGLAYWLIAGGKKNDDEGEETDDRRDDNKKAKAPAAAERKSAGASSRAKVEDKKADEKADGEKPGKGLGEEKPDAEAGKREPDAKAPEAKKRDVEEPDKKADEEEAEEKTDAEKTSGGETGEDASAEERDETATAAGDEAVSGDGAQEPPQEEAEEPAPKEAREATEETAKKGAGEKPVDDEAAKAERKARRKALRKGLKSTRGGFIAKLGSLLKGKKTVDPELLEKIEEVLVTADVGVQFTERLITSMKESLSGTELTDPDIVWEHMREQAYAILTPDAPPWDIERERPFVIMVIGVNGVGKTTTIAKLASRYVKAGKKVVLAAGDTFRAAAVRQLEMWGQRVGAEVVKRDKAGADPSAVVYDAIERGIEVGADVIIADTAGRLHTKAPLMDELKKVKRVMGKALAGAPHEVLLVLDSNTGQNAIHQTREFQESLGVTGIVLTKLDGTAKGGVIMGICEEHKIPVRFIGVGERDDDLREFDAEDFVSVLFERPEDAGESAA